MPSSRPLRPLRTLGPLDSPAPLEQMAEKQMEEPHQPVLVLSNEPVTYVKGIADGLGTGAGVRVFRYKDRALVDVLRKSTFTCAVVDLTETDEYVLEVIGQVQKISASWPLVCLSPWLPPGYAGMSRDRTFYFLHTQRASAAFPQSVQRQPSPLQVSFRGEFQAESLLEVVQLLLISSVSGQLVVWRRWSRGELWIHEGHIVHAELGERRGRAAVKSLLEWPRGTFRLQMGRTPLVSLQIGLTDPLFQLLPTEPWPVGDGPHASGAVPTSSGIAPSSLSPGMSSDSLEPAMVDTATAQETPDTLAAQAPPDKAGQAETRRPAEPESLGAPPAQEPRSARSEPDPISEPAEPETLSAVQQQEPVDEPPAPQACSEPQEQDSGSVISDQETPDALSEAPSHESLPHEGRSESAAAPAGAQSAEQLEQTLEQAWLQLDATGHFEGAAPIGGDTPAVTSSTVKDALAKLEQGVEGFIGAAVVDSDGDSDSGRCLGWLGGGDILNIEAAATGSTEVVRANRKAMSALSLCDDIDDMLISMGKQYDLIRPLRSRPSLFIYLAVDRTRANLAMARFALVDAERDLGV